MFSAIIIVRIFPSTSAYITQFEHSFQTTNNETSMWDSSNSERIQSQIEPYCTNPL